jgi:hypothetical protein
MSKQQQPLQAPKMPTQHLAHEEQPWIEGTTVSASPEPAVSAQPHTPGDDDAVVGGVQTSDATRNNFDASGTESLGYDSPPLASSDIANTDVAGYDHSRPYYGPGGGGPNRELERSEGAATPQRDVKQDRPLN